METYEQMWLDHLAAIRLHTESLQTTIPEKLEEIRKSLVDVYKNAGKPSRPQQSGPTGTGDSGASSRTVSETEAARVLRQALFNPAKKEGGRRRGSPGLPFPEDYDERELGLYGGSASSGASSESWLDRIIPQSTALPLPRLEGAKLTLSDKAAYVADAMATLANRKRKRLQAEVDKMQENPDHWDKDAETFEAAAKSDEIRAKIERLNNDKGDMGGGLASKLSNAANTFGAAYSQGQYILGTFQSMATPLHRMSDLGFRTGAEGGSPGIFGLRSPFDPAVMAGFHQRIAQFGMSFGADAVTPGQAHTIMDNLYKQGWMDVDNPQVQAMRTASQRMMRANPYIASEPQYYEMMDKATRQGTTSLSHFNDVMKQIPDAAKAAHTSLEDTMAAMNQLGDYNKTIGGTYISGLANAQTWQTVTGTSADMMGSLMQNPLVVGQTFNQTGLPPWEQGLASPGQHIQSILGAVNLLNRSIIGHGQSTQIGQTGFYNNVSNQDAKEALMSHFLGVSKEYVHTMLTNQRGWQAGSQLSDEATAYSTSVRNNLRTGHYDAAQKVLSGTGAGTWGQLSKDLSLARDAQGHPVIEDWDYYNKVRSLRNSGVFSAFGTIPSKHEAGLMAQQKAKHDVQYAGMREVLDYMNAHSSIHGPGGARQGATWEQMERQRGRTQEQMFEDAMKGGKLPDQVRQDVAYARTKKIHDYQKMNTEKFGSNANSSTGPKLTIELGPAAKKMFHINDPTKQFKSNVGAGSADMSLNSWAQGPTWTPSANLDTAGGYDYGPQYSTDSNSQ